MKKFLLLPMVVVFVFFTIYLKFTPTRKEKPVVFERAIAGVMVVDPSEVRDTNRATDVYLILDDYTFAPLKTSQEWDERVARLNPSNNLIAVEESIDTFKDFQIVVGDGIAWKVICTHCDSVVWISDTELTYSTRYDNYHVPSKKEYVGFFYQQVLTGEVKRIDEDHWATKARLKKLDRMSSVGYERVIPSPKIECGFVGSTKIHGVTFATRNPRTFCGQSGPNIYYLVIDDEFIEQSLHISDIWKVE